MKYEGVVRTRLVKYPVSNVNVSFLIGIDEEHFIKIPQNMLDDTRYQKGFYELNYIVTYLFHELQTHPASR